MPSCVLHLPKLIIQHKETMKYCLLFEGETDSQHLKFDLCSSQLTAKCLQNVWSSYFVAASVGLWFLYWHHVLVSSCLFVLPCQTSQAIDNLILLELLAGQRFSAKLIFWAGSIRFDIQSKLNMYLTLQPHKMRTINCNKHYAQYVDHLACFVDWPTIGITDPAEIAGNAGLGQQRSMHFEICLLCATAPVCMFLFLVHLNDFHFVWFEVFFAL